MVVVVKEEMRVVVVEWGDGVVVLVKDDMGVVVVEGGGGVVVLVVVEEMMVWGGEGRDDGGC